MMVDKKNEASSLSSVDIHSGLVSGGVCGLVLSTYFLRTKKMEAVRYIPRIMAGCAVTGGCFVGSHKLAERRQIYSKNELGAISGGLSGVMMALFIGPHPVITAGCGLAGIGFGMAFENLQDQLYSWRRKTILQQHGVTEDSIQQSSPVRATTSPRQSSEFASMTTAAPALRTMGGPSESETSADTVSLHVGENTRHDSARMGPQGQVESTLANSIASFFKRSTEEKGDSGEESSLADTKESAYPSWLPVLSNEEAAEFKARQTHIAGLRLRIKDLERELGVEPGAPVPDE